MNIVTRFAPSPTGDLHVGSVRTALYCWLFTQKHHGKFILRIEDTDLERSTTESVDVILAGLKWLNLNWDEGPFFQTDRFARYAEVANQMLANNQAYRCYCSKERLEELRTNQLVNKQKPRYDGHCREKNLAHQDSTPYVIRFKNPTSGHVEFNDLVRGKITVANTELDDLILIRSNGSPTYNFTVVIDDLDMQITDVIRGEDHISNTPKQINILKALGAAVPHYAHIPMILGSDGTRLSKRHGASSVLEYEKMGILPHALLNYLARLGWAHKDQEIFSIEELINLFDIQTVHKSAAIFDVDKLLWLNHHYITTSDIKDLITPFKKQLRELGLQPNSGHPDLSQVIALLRTRAKTIKEMAEQSTYFFQDHLEINQETLQKLQPTNAKNTNDSQHMAFNLKNILKDLIAAFKNLEFWDANNIHALLKTFTEQHNLKFSDLAIPLRVITTGKNQTPSIDQVLALIGKQKVLARIELYLLT